MTLNYMAVSLASRHWRRRESLFCRRPIVHRREASSLQASRIQTSASDSSSSMSDEASPAVVASKSGFSRSLML